jgi:hypothetical protein
MAPLTTVALKALEQLGGPRIILAAVPGGIKAVAAEAGVSRSRVSQILRQAPLPRQWAQLLAEMIGCTEVEIYQQLGESPPVSPYGPLFDPPAGFSNRRSEESAP